MSTTTNPGSRAIDVRFGTATLEVKLADGRELIAPLTRYPRLRDGPPAARLNWRFIDGGAGLRWPDLDVDVSVEELE
ncbi:DUF2442 domain-containing protein [Devosia sp.]|uniref:DUF2442 domain-containing protein n=1 Tax=Devosia sp. TaxID=1871048 RepID=UPI003F714243